MHTINVIPLWSNMCGEKTEQSSGGRNKWHIQGALALSFGEAEAWFGTFCLLRMRNPEGSNADTDGSIATQWESTIADEFWVRLFRDGAGETESRKERLCH